MTMKTIEVKGIVQDDSVLGRYRGGELRRLAVEALQQDFRLFHAQHEARWKEAMTDIWLEWAGMQDLITQR